MTGGAPCRVISRPGIEHAGRAQRESAQQGLHLLDKKPAGGGKQLYNDDALGLFSYDAAQVPL